jgi:hypothetical protein
MKHFTCTALLISMFWAPLAIAQSVDSTQPMKVRLTGTMLPFAEQQRDDLVTATIFVQDKPWFFRVGKAEGLTSAEREQAVKDGALLEQVRFQGPDAVMRRLQKANLIGKLLVIEGQLDAKGRRFLISSVEETK